jgi:hypothetical protein
MNNTIHKSFFSAKKFFSGLSLIFFFLMLVIPTTYQLERGVLLSILCMGAFIGSSRGAWKINRQIVMILLLTVSASLVFMFNGLIHNAPGALRVGTVNVLWPMLYVFFAGFFCRPETIIKVQQVIVWGIIVSAAMGIALVSEAFLGLNYGIKSLLSFQGAAVGIYSGYIEYRLFNMTTLIYGFPFLATLFLLKNRKNSFLLRKNFLLWVAFVLLLLAAAISGRRAFWLLIVLTPFIIGALFLISGQRRAFKRIAKLILPMCIFVLCISFTPIIDISGIGNQFLSVIEEFSSGPRYNQFHALITEWVATPILGHGAGAAAENIIRSKTMTWAYELSYVALLFHTGIVGVCIYSFAVVWVFAAGINIVRRLPQAAPVMLPLLAALAGFLIVNATNPYLGKFDYLWTLFLPVAAINAYRTDARFSTSSSSTGIPETNSQTA